MPRKILEELLKQFFLYEYRTYKKIEQKITISRFHIYSRDTWVQTKRKCKKLMLINY